MHISHDFMSLMLINFTYSSLSIPLLNDFLRFFNAW